MVESTSTPLNSKDAVIGSFNLFCGDPDLGVLGPTILPPFRHPSGTFIVTYFLGFTLNTFTLLGLTLAIGIVVDDAIMVLENIVRHRELGEDRVGAAIFGAREITFAALAATVAILAIFLPVVFMKGIIGKFFYQFGVTITAAVSFSLLEALTLAPMRCSRFLEIGEKRNPLTRWVDATFVRLAQLYRRGLERCLARRWTVMAAGIAVFAASIATFKGIRKEFTPSQDQSIFLMRLQTPVGSSMAFTDGRFKQAENWLLSQPAVKRYYGAVGGFGGGEVNAGMLFITLKEPKDRPKGPDGKQLTQAAFMNLARKEVNKIPDLKGIVMDLSQGGFSASRGFPVEFTLRGPEGDAGGARAIHQEDEAAGEFIDIDTDYKQGMPEIRVFPDRSKAMPAFRSTRLHRDQRHGRSAAAHDQDATRHRVRGEENSGLVPRMSRAYVRNNRGRLFGSPTS